MPLGVNIACLSSPDYNMSGGQLCEKNSLIDNVIIVKNSVCQGDNVPLFRTVPEERQCSLLNHQIGQGSQSG